MGGWRLKAMWLPDPWGARILPQHLVLQLSLPVQFSYAIFSAWNPLPPPSWNDVVPGSETFIPKLVLNAFLYLIEPPCLFIVGVQSSTFYLAVGHQSLSLPLCISLLDRATQVQAWQQPSPSRPVQHTCLHQTLTGTHGVWDTICEHWRPSNKQINPQQKPNHYNYDFFIE